MVFCFGINTKCIRLHKLYSWLDKVKPIAKHAIDVTLRLPPDMIGSDKNDFPRNLLLTNRQVASLRKAFVSSSSKDIKS